MALDLLQDEPVDILFTDLRLPERDGISLLVEVLQQRPELPCVVMTGYASVESSVEALRLGARDYVFKPITPQKIISALQRSLPVEADSAAPAVGRRPTTVPPSDELLAGRGEDDPTAIVVPLKGDLRAMNRFLVREVILRCDGNKAAAARTLGMHRRSLYRLLEEDGGDRQIPR